MAKKKSAKKKRAGQKKVEAHKKAVQPEPEEDKWASRRKWLIWGALIAIAIIFFALRLRNLGQLMAWDETQLALTVKSYGHGVKDVWSSLAYIHPPLSLWILCAVAKFFGYHVVIYKVVSILLSFGVLCITYLLAKRLFGHWVALLTAFCLAVLPAATVLDTWIKQDPLADLFIVLTVYLFVRGNWKWAGVVFGLALLSKETAVFAFVILLVYSLVLWDRKKVYRSLGVMAIGAVISFWFYAFMSVGVSHFFGIFTGGQSEGVLFKHSLPFYFTGLPVDLGWPLLIALSIGFFVCLYTVIWKRKRDYALPLIWFVVMYALFSISATKPYWVIPPAFPAIAMLCGIGIYGVAQLVRRLSPAGKRAKVPEIAFIAVFAGLLLAFGIALNYTGYNRARYPQFWDYATSVRQDAVYLKEKAGETPVIAILDEKTENRDPVLTYYLGDTKEIALASGILDKPDVLLEKFATPYNAQWIYIRKGGDEMSRKTTDFFKKLGAIHYYQVTRDSKWGFTVSI